jgi:hypothetical protein
MGDEGYPPIGDRAETLADLPADKRWDFAAALLIVVLARRDSVLDI